MRDLSQRRVSMAVVLGLLCWGTVIAERGRRANGRSRPLSIQHIPVIYPTGSLSGRGRDMVMVRATIFQSNRSQAVRLPKDVAFPDGVKQVTVLRDGKRRVIVPANPVWDEFFDAPGIDLAPREQSEAQVREAL